MPLATGAHLGNYEILGPLGKGGMGEVYRARDTRLKRDVALKVLPDEFAQDPERIARFTREAEVLASLNHPNIAAIYGVEDRALAMELVDGESPKGPLPFEEAWKIASQIADALEYAHEKGVIHRDLKPANIKVTHDGVVKLLDFGLAKAFQEAPDSRSGDPVNSPTITMGATVAGTLMGTAAYMAPEQAKGKRVDKRADIWAFGVVLYELLLGERPFRGEDLTEVLASVVKEQPDLSVVPARVRPLLEKCLEKDPRKRLRDISGAELLLGRGTHVATLSKPWLWPLATGAALLVGAALAAILLRPPAPSLRPFLRMDVDLGENVSLGSNVAGPDIAISPDGSRLAYISAGRLFTRRLDQINSSPLELDTSPATGQPLFSPDGKWIGFTSPAALNKIAVDGGPSVRLTGGGPFRGFTWGSDGNLIGSLNQGSALFRIPEGGGAPQPVTQLGPGEFSHRWPQALPGGLVLFTSGRPPFDNAAIEVLDPAKGVRKALLRGGWFGRYLEASDGTGYLTYVTRGGTLFAVPFDLRRLEVRGTPVPVLEGVGYGGGDGWANLDVSQTGTLVYRSGGANTQVSRVIQFLDANGKLETFPLKPDVYSYPRLSPDGRRLLLVAGAVGNLDLWIYDLAARRSSRLTIGAGPGSLTPIWTPDGRFVLIQGSTGVTWTRSDGGNQPQPLTRSRNSHYPWSFTPDGKRLAYYELSPETTGDLWTVAVESDGTGLKAGTPEKFLQTPQDERHPSFSPDGRWIAYDSDETGRPEIYVRAFPDRGGRWIVSNSGGRYPVFSGNGRDLYYRTEEGQLLVARYSVKDDTFVSEPPRVFSEKRVLSIPTVGTYDVASDGRIVGLFPSEESRTQRPQTQVTFLLNFADELRRRLGTGK